MLAGLVKDKFLSLGTDNTFSYLIFLVLYTV